MDLIGYRCVAIAYEWKFAPTSIRDFTILLTLARTDCTLDGDAAKHWTNWDAEHTTAYSYRVQLPPATGLRQSSDVAGLFGLLGPDRMPASEERAAAFERAVSDAVMWELAATNVEKDSAGRFPLILLQGPLLPKLRGRIFYRYVDPDLPVLAVTFQPEWLVHLVKDVRPMRTGSAPHGNALLAWEGPFPPLAIDSGSRAFLGMRSNRPQYHVEVPANAWDAREGESWWATRRDICEAAFSDRWRVAAPGSHVAPLPVPLAAASLRARKRLKEDCGIEFGFANFATHFEQMQEYPRKPAGKTGVKRLTKPVLCYRTLEAIVGAVPASVGGSAPGRLTVSDLRKKCFSVLDGGDGAAGLRELLAEWAERDSDDD